MLLEQVLARWRHLVAFMKATNVALAATGAIRSK